MGVDYYKLLQVPRNANNDDLKKAAEAKLKEISDAYHVLSDPRKRAVYDQHGEEGLKRRPPPPSRAGQHGRNPEDIFSEFFGFGSATGGGSRGDNSREGRSRSPEDIFSEFFGGSGSMGESRDPKDASFFEYFSGGSGSAGEDGGVRSGSPRKAAPIEKILPCRLEELYKGTTKKMKISRDVLGVSGRRSTVEEVLTIEIKAGWKKGTKITFPEKGNDLEQGVIPADIVFVIDEKPHSVFKRDGDDLIVTRNISLEEALTGHTKLTTLDGRNIVATGPFPNLTHEVLYEGEGMPIQKKGSKKGNLIMKFDIEFPKLTSEQKTRIKQLLTSS